MFRDQSYQNAVLSRSERRSQETMSNSMISNPKLVALLERVDQLMVQKKANGMSGSSMILNSAFIDAANEYGVDLHDIEHSIIFSGENHPIVASHDCKCASLIEGPSSTEYDAWLSTSEYMRRRLENNDMSVNAGYEIWRNVWLRCREIVYSYMQPRTTLLYRLARWVFVHRDCANEFEESRDLLLEVCNLDRERCQTEVIEWRPAE